MKYRPEIDGLRTVAVVPVIFFHAGFSFFSGGFVGVDIFFVISGYLITTVLADEIDNGSFKISNFYERRIRRILPALYFVIICNLPLAWLLMSPEQMTSFFKSIIAVVLFASNFLFWRESGYFSTVAEEKPLLHTWSLAVEEQYYLFFPLLLMLFWKFGKHRVFWLIIACSICSLLISEWGWRNYSVPNFYLLPSRAWELLVGSIAAFIVRSSGVRTNQLLANTGMVLLLLSIFYFDSSIPFPSLYTLLPVMGTFLIIVFAGRSTFVASFLSAKPMVGIGLISYSAYLWHQPLLAYAKIRLFDHPSSALMLFMAIFSLLLAWFSWKYIEAPFRNKKVVSRKRIFSYAAISSGFLLVLGVLGVTSDGFNQYRFNTAEIALFDSSKPSSARDECHFPQDMSALSRQPCKYFADNVTVAIIGNSHATELAMAVATRLKEKNVGIVHHTISGCNHNYNVSDELDTICQRWHAGVVDSVLKDKNIDTVVLSYRNESYLEQVKYRASLVEMANILVSNQKNVYLVLQAPLIEKSIEKYLMKRQRGESDYASAMSLESWREIYSSAQLLKSELPASVKIIDPADIFCSDGVTCLAIIDDTALYFDDNHLSVHGAELLVEHILNDALKEGYQR